MLRVKPELLAQEIRQAREAAHLSQVALAHQLGVSPRTVQNWESGRIPQIRHRKALADFLEKAA